MKNYISIAAYCILLLGSCKKEVAVQHPTEPGFKEFIISKGQHYAGNNVVKEIELSELKFIARFDSSAIYTSRNSENQYDINKLYGFSDNGGQHHLFSARIGWRWSNDSLRLFGYTYNKGERSEKELGTVTVGKDISCSIKVLGDWYEFSIPGSKHKMPRQSSTMMAQGYQLYPYFGGDEAAPHDVHIWIKESK